MDVKQSENKSSNPQRIGVIKLSALGDLIQATGAMADIRTHYPEAHITLLTTAPYVELAEAMPWIDAVKVDSRFRFWRLDKLAPLFEWLQGLDMVYDLQGQSRTAWYQFFSGNPAWSAPVLGPNYGIWYPDHNPLRQNQHAVEIFRVQLRQCDVEAQHAPDVIWAGTSLPKDVKINTDQAIGILTGCSPQHPQKRYPYYAEVIQVLQQQGATCYLFGTDDEGEIIDDLSAQTGAISLKNKLNLRQTISAFEKLDFIIGNDTGPLHIAAACGLNGVGVYGPYSHPTRHAPRGSGKVEVLHTDSWAHLPPQKIIAAVQKHPAYVKVPL